MAAALPVLANEGGLSRYLDEIRKFPMLEPSEEYMLAKRWREHGDREAAHKLVTSHLRLVAKIAMGYRGYGLPISEVVSEGNVGLMQAVKRFEPEKGFRLATYAMWWIKAAIQEYILRSWSLVKMGTTANQKKLFFNLRKAKGRISALEEGDLRPDQVKQIATQLGVTEQDVVDMNRRLGGDASLNAPLREEGEGEWQDWLVDDSAEPGADRSSRKRKARTGSRPCATPVGPQSARAPHLRGAAPVGRSDHARGSLDRVRRLARARPADRGAGLREDPGGGEEEPRADRGTSAEAPMPDARHKIDDEAAESRARGASIATGGRRSFIDLLAGRALLETEDRALPRGHPDRQIDPVAADQQFGVALHVARQVRQADQEEVLAHRHGQSGDRGAARGLLVLELQQADIADHAAAFARRGS